MKYKVGDLVRLKRIEELREITPFIQPGSACQAFAGEICVVTETREQPYAFCRLMPIDSCVLLTIVGGLNITEYMWHEDYLVSVKEEPENPEKDSAFDRLITGA